MSWRPMDLAPQYLESIATVRRLAAKALRDGNDLDLPILRGMDENLQWTLKYMATGDDRATYTNRRPVPVDPTQLGEWIEAMQMASPIRDTEQPRMDVLPVLDQLSERELEAYLLVKGDGFSYADAARLMGIGKWTVRDYIERAKAKIAACRVLSSLPHEMGL